MALLAEKTIGFIGGGKMAEAILKGILQAEAIGADRVAVTDVSTGRLEYLAQTYGVRVAHNNPDTNEGAAKLSALCDITVFAVKPQFARPVLEAVGAAMGAERLAVSIMAGVRLSTLEELLPSPVVRVMPNTPMMVREGVAGIVPGSKCRDIHSELVREMFRPLGAVYDLNEKRLDAMTAISGCGPAYAYVFIEALADGGVEAGLPRETAYQIAAQTLVGAGKMVLAGDVPAKLKDDVCSPGGTTIAGVHALEHGGFRAAVLDALAASLRRSEEIEKGI